MIYQGIINSAAVYPLLLPRHDLAANNMGTTHCSLCEATRVTFSAGGSASPAAKSYKLSFRHNCTCLPFPFSFNPFSLLLSCIEHSGSCSAIVAVALKLWQAMQ